MSVYDKNNKFLSYLLVLASLFILVLFTKDQFFKMQENLDLKDSYSIKLKDTKEKLKQINEIKSKLANSSENIDKYDIIIKEDDIVDYLYGYIEKINKGDEISIIKSINISDPKDTELGFKETDIDLNILVPSEEKLKEIINFLVSSESKYNFFIKSFEYPYGNLKGNFAIKIPLKILYK